MAAAGKITVAQVEELVGLGNINPDHIITPGIFVHRLIKLDKVTKHIERRTTRPREAAE